ncbi:hypothetical protein TEA_001964 [Camellia sinensis var. sinensis]|uniref:Uncharacterized protein n=1 Tax=Camellia sinensis var. sinensis TaxID=542762 RepID=A0A4S4DVL9_CAMSN|nr:hypothetical protein TEA_001964 [Camellia sinensis var. sinensis]
MARIVKSCLQLLLKLVNSTLGIVGISMILYSIWMVRVWQRDLDDSSSSSLHYNHFSLPCLCRERPCGDCLSHINNVSRNRDMTLYIFPSPDFALAGACTREYRAPVEMRCSEMFIDSRMCYDPKSVNNRSIHALLGIGIAMCAIACLGHIAADTANACCLCCYMVMIFVLLLVETAFMADIFLNSDWEKDLPEDPTGRFDDFIDFVKSNFDTCKWMALLTVLAQGCSILVATVLRNLDEKDKRRNYDNDDGDYSTVPGLPFLNHPMPVQPLPYTVADLPFPSKTETWKV